MSMLHLTPASCIHSNHLLTMWSPSLLLRQNQTVSVYVAYPLYQHQAELHVILYISFQHFTLFTVVSKPVMENSVLVSGGESINLTCAFKTKGNYSNNPFVVLWIKTGAQSSTCVYSFDYDADYVRGFDDHCAIDKDLLLRRSHTSRPSLDDDIHNLKISNATQSDCGQYLCVLMVDKNSHQYSAVISNTTVIVDNPGKSMNLT